MKNTGIESPQKSQMELSDGSGIPLEKFLFTSLKIFREKFRCLGIMEQEPSMKTLKEEISITTWPKNITFTLSCYF